MKSVLSFAFSLMVLFDVHAQMSLNSIPGVTPQQDIEIYTQNGLLVQKKFSFTTVDPTTSINILSCAANSAVILSKAGILKDPGGDSNYPASLSCTQKVSNMFFSSGYEIVFEDLDTEANGDIVTIIDDNGNKLLFSGNTLPGPVYVASYQFTVQFQSNSNTTVGRGFQLRWRSLQIPATPTMSTNAFGAAFQYDSRSGALIGGDLKLGQLQNTGIFSIAYGFQNLAGGRSSAAFGSNNTASGNTSTALGFINTASGTVATAIGYNNIASGNYSTAMGSKVSTNGQAGVFVIGDSDPLGQGMTPVGVSDSFVGRFLNGYFLLTSGNSNPGGGTYGNIRTGVQIGRGQNSWATISDSTKKERFMPIDQTGLLRKIEAMKLSTWNYKGQRTIRHYGPMAQDFYAAFGQDGLGQIGCDTLIYSHDFAGVTFAGVQALIQENATLKAELTQTNARLTQTMLRLDALEATWIFQRQRKAISFKTKQIAHK